MQATHLNSPAIVQRLTTQQQQNSCGIDELIQKAEFENNEQVKLIETEKQRYSALLRQLDQKTHQVEDLEKSTTQLDEEAKQLYKQFTQNREICESLKRTNSILQEHEEALQKKKENSFAKVHQSRLENQCVLTKYQAIWNRYKEQYERRENAKELERIKTSAKQENEQLEKIQLQVQQLRIDISSMEMEKKQIDEIKEAGFQSAIPVVIKLAHLHLETKSTTASLQEVISNRKSTEQELIKISTEKEQLSKSPKKGAELTEVSHISVNACPARTRQLQDADSLSGSRPLPQTSVQTITEEHMDQSNKDKEPPQDRDVNEEPDSSTLSGESLSHTQISINKDQQLHTSFENTQATPKTSEDQQQLHPETQIQCQTSKDAVEQSGYGRKEKGSTIPKSPISGLNQQTSCSEPTSSPFNFEDHSSIIQQLTKSPGDGFLFQSRPMFQISVNEDNEQVSQGRANFVFDMQEETNFPGTGPTGEFQMCTQNSNLFGAAVTAESRRDTRFFGTSASPFSACSIFGEPSPTTTNQQPESAEFSFSFGPTSLTTDDSSSNRSSTFSLFESFN
ncbi:nucleoprotein TPR-like [Acropora millepora]|uniref:nucleoprotein TPR-like n=1 Tax=Acropora millepora TaxID=45264 RepID=UPI001CF523F9|nr:nucleoprotein TPR-like [Acropora millepora]